MFIPYLEFFNCGITSRSPAEPGLCARPPALISACSGQCAVERALEMLQAGLTYAFESLELRIDSLSRGRDVQHVTNGA